MGYTWDPEVGRAFKPMQDAAGAFIGRLASGDIAGRRAQFTSMLAQVSKSSPSQGDVSTKDFYVKTKDGHELKLRWVYKVETEAKSQLGPAIFHIHGGGMILGSVELTTPGLVAHVSRTTVPILSVEYRLAPEYPHPTPVEDSYLGLTWLYSNASDLGVDSSRIAIMGESAGGGIAAGMALMARDRKLDPPLAKQILFSPMLDDRITDRDELVEPFAFWTYDDNVTGWGALLGQRVGRDDVDYYAAPARATDLLGLPDTYLDVGQLDILLYEDMDYIRRLSKAGVNVEFHLHPGCCHSFERFAMDASVSKRVYEDRRRVMKSF